jgi:bisphosphoglycerate-independent phosphoglycerate mutase (AlkP superfamily)
MIKKISFLLLLFLFLCNLNSQEKIEWDKAHLYIGKFVIVEGTIVDTYNSGRACFLNFHPDYKKHLTAVIFASDFYKFPPNPEDYYLNKKVRIKGLIKEYKGKPEIILNDPFQIEIIDQKKAIEIEEVISWEDADKFYGKIVTVEGIIVATRNTGRVCFLNFHRNWRRYLTLVIFASDFYKFPDNPEIYYLNKKVRVRGLIKEYQGKPEIILKNPDQIIILKDSS